MSRPTPPQPQDQASPEPLARLSRRAALGRLGWGAAGLLGAALVPGSAQAAPAKASKIRDIEKSSLGTTIYMQLESAPFPAPGARYTDDTVIVFVPKHFRVHKQDNYRIDTLMHFHGHRDTADQAMKRHQLREQLAASKQNAILVLPQGPVKAEDSRGGKLDQPKGLLNLLTEIRKTLQTSRLQLALKECGVPNAARIGKLILSAHSGGYKVAAHCVARGGYNVNEVWLFDALYARVDEFRDWLAAAAHHDDMDNRRKLISYYSGEQPTRANNQLMRDLKRLGIKYLHETREGELSRKDFVKARAIFIVTQTSHQGTVYKYNNLRDCLYASCFKRYLKSDWFDEIEGPRPLDARDRRAQR